MLQQLNRIVVAAEQPHRRLHRIDTHQRKRLLPRAILATRLQAERGHLLDQILAGKNVAHTAGATALVTVVGNFGHHGAQVVRLDGVGRCQLGSANSGIRGRFQPLLFQPQVHRLLVEGNLVQVTGRINEGVRALADAGVFLVHAVHRRM